MRWAFFMYVMKKIRRMGLTRYARASDSAGMSRVTRQAG